MDEDLNLAVRWVRNSSKGKMLELDTGYQDLLDLISMARVAKGAMNVARMTDEVLTVHEKSGKVKRSEYVREQWQIVNDHPETPDMASILRSLV